MFLNFEQFQGLNVLKLFLIQTHFLTFLISFKFVIEEKIKENVIGTTK